MFNFKRQKALDVTGDKGVEQAMEWLLAHSDDSEVAPPPQAAPPNVSSGSGASDDAGAADAGASASASSCSSTSEPTPEVKSFKCEEWYNLIGFFGIFFQFLEF